MKNQKQFEKQLKDQVPSINPFLYATDSYKVSHINFEIDGVKEIYSNFTPRFSKYMEEMLGKAYDKKYVVFGVQWMLMRLHMMAKKGFFDRKWDDVLSEFKSVHTAYIGNTNFDHFKKLHTLGYIPIKVKTLDEGTVAPVGVPFLTVQNTLPEFEWLPNYLETLFSTDLWKPITIATIAREYRLNGNKFAIQTKGNIEGVEWQNHDFSCRGQSGLEGSAINGVAFLLSSCGTDNIPALWAADKFYDSTNNDGLLAESVQANEHSIVTLGILTECSKAALNNEIIDLVEAEYRYKKWLLTERFKTGIVSDVSDSFDYWSHITINLPKLKDVIMARDGKYVVRGDSGNPVHIIAGYKILDLTESFDSTDGALSKYHNWYETNVEVIKVGSNYTLLEPLLDGDECYGLHPKSITESEALGTIQYLWNIFGGTVNELGFKELDSHIGMIYGDGITIQRQTDILTRLQNKGFVSTSIVFGAGSYSLNLVGRDHLGMAIKATNAVIELDGHDVSTAIYKDPKTDSSKKSLKGRIKVNDDLTYTDNVSLDESNTGLLTDVYVDGQFKKLTNVFEIREKMWK